MLGGSDATPSEQIDTFGVDGPLDLVDFNSSKSTVSCPVTVRLTHQGRVGTITSVTAPSYPRAEHTALKAVEDPGRTTTRPPSMCFLSQAALLSEVPRAALGPPRTQLCA